MTIYSLDVLLSQFGSVRCSMSEKAMARNSITLAWKIPWTEEPGSCSPWGCWGSDTTERLTFHFSLSCTGEGKGNPIQCSCLENPRDGGAWWVAVYGVAQSRTQLKWLSSSILYLTMANIKGTDTQCVPSNAYSGCLINTVGGDHYCWHQCKYMILSKSLLCETVHFSFYSFYYNFLA